MKRLLTVALAAASLTGMIAASASPAAAQEHRGGHERGGSDRGHERGGSDRHDHDRGGRGREEWREHSGWNDRRGWRGHDRDYGDGWRFARGAYTYGNGSDCYSSWRWNPYWGRNVRVTYCN